MRKKFKIAYAEDLQEIRNLFGLMIEGELDCDLVEFGTGNDLIAFLKTNTDVDLVLTDYNMPDGTGGDVYNYLKEDGNKIPCILTSSEDPGDHTEFSDFFETNKNNHAVTKPFNFDELIDIIKKFIPVAVDHEYKAVRIERFLNLSPVSVDIYIRLSEVKYVKLLKQGETFNIDQLKKYITDENIEYFHVKSLDFRILIDTFSEKLNEVLSQKNLKFKDRLDAELTGVAFIHDVCNELGINQSTIDTVNEITKSTLSVIKKSNPRVFKMLVRMIDGDGFLYSHSLMTSYLSCEIAQRMEWSSPELYKKFSIAALLHDVGESEKNIKHNILTEVLKNELAQLDLKSIKEHPQRNFELVQEISSIPSDVGTLILNHHERPDGSGFPRGLGSLKTSPLSCTFILAHEFVHKLYENGCDASKAKDIFGSLRAEFNVGNYKNPYAGLALIINAET